MTRMVTGQVVQPVVQHVVQIGRDSAERSTPLDLASEAETA